MPPAFGEARRHGSDWFRSDVSRRSVAVHAGTRRHPLTPIRRRARRVRWPTVCLNR